MFSYFDAHCDTIYRCRETGEKISMEFADAEERRKYFAVCQCLRENGGHIDLARARAFDRYAQFFALFYDANDAPKDEMWALCQRLRDFFLREMAANEDLICQCRTGAERLQTGGDKRRKFAGKSHALYDDAFGDGGGETGDCPRTHRQGNF